MKTQTRTQFNAYRQRLAALNGLQQVEDTAAFFSVAPAVAQRLEVNVQESSAFLRQINVIGVDELEGEPVGLGMLDPIASRQKTAGGNSTDRAPREAHSLDGNAYRCAQTNFDVAIGYEKLDAWAKFPDFQRRLTDQVARRVALDRIMIGFNGTSRADTSDPVENPLLQDVGIGWLEQIRTRAPAQWLHSVDGVEGVPVGGAKDHYQTLDAVAWDLGSHMLQPWLREAPGLVVICGRELLADERFRLVNSKYGAREQLALQQLLERPRIGFWPALTPPGFPPDAMMLTRLDNLSVYYQRSAQRRAVIDNPKRDRIETYQSSNDAYVIEDLDGVALATGITLAPAP